MNLSIILVLLIISFNLKAQSPKIISNEGKYLGDLNDNPFDPSSVSNPYGIYGSPFSPESVNNPYGPNGSAFSGDSVNNSLSSSSAPKIYSSDGAYLGRLSKNVAEPDSVSNPYGSYGSPYSPSSINNPYGLYGSPYSQKSATFIYGSPFFKENDKNNEEVPREDSFSKVPFENDDMALVDEGLESSRAMLRESRKKTEFLKRISEELKAEIRQKKNEKANRKQEIEIILNNKEALDFVVYQYKEYMLKLYKNGSILELENLYVPEETYSELSENERLTFKKYIDNRINNIKQVLLSKK